MAKKLIFKTRFVQKLDLLMIYLQNNWGDQVAQKFISKLDRRISNLSLHPYIGKQSTKKKDVRSISITYQNRLYYRIKGDFIEILNIYDTRRHPSKNPY